MTEPTDNYMWPGISKIANTTFILCFTEERTPDRLWLNRGELTEESVRMSNKKFFSFQ